MEPSYRGSANAQPPGNGRLAEACGVELLHVTRMVGDARWSSMPFAMLTCLRNAGFNALAENLALKLRKYRQSPGYRPPYGVVKSNVSLSEIKPTPSA